MSRGCLAYINEKRHSRKAQGIRLSKADFQAEFQALKQEFDRLLVDCRPANGQVIRSAKHPDEAADIAAYAAKARSTLWDMSSLTSPFTPEAAQRVIDLHAPAGAGGLTERLSGIRSVFHQRCFVADAGAIDGSERYERHQPCQEVCPGVCRTRDAATLPVVNKLVKAMHAAAADWPDGAFYEVRILAEECAMQSVVLMRAHSEANLAVVVRCKFDGKCVSLKSADGMLDFTSEAEALMGLVKQSTGRVQSATTRRLQVVDFTNDPQCLDLTCVRVQAALPEVVLFEIAPIVDPLAVSGSIVNPAAKADAAEVALHPIEAAWSEFCSRHRHVPDDFDSEGSSEWDMLVRAPKKRRKRQAPKARIRTARLLRRPRARSGVEGLSKAPLEPQPVGISSSPLALEGSPSSHRGPPPPGLVPQPVAASSSSQPEPPPMLASQPVEASQPGPPLPRLGGDESSVEPGRRLVAVGGGINEGGERAAKRQRFDCFGPFKVAPVFNRGVQVGFGGTCGRHFDDGDDCLVVACKKQLRFCGESPELCLRRIKMWLLDGLEVACETPSARRDHLRLNPRAKDPPSMQELDARADRIP